MPYPMSYELYRAPGFYAWFCKEPLPCGNNTLNIYLRNESLLIDKRQAMPHTSAVRSENETRRT